MWSASHWPFFLVQLQEEPFLELGDLGVPLSGLEPLTLLQETGVLTTTPVVLSSDHNPD